MVSLVSIDDPAEMEFVKVLIFRHAEYTGSKRAAAILLAWDEFVSAIVRVMPNDYKRALETRSRSANEPHLEMTAFELNAQETVRAAGN